MRELRLIGATLILLFIKISSSFAQSKDWKNHPDTSKRITLIQFNKKIDDAISFLTTKKLGEIPDTAHINIMMCLNTIAMTNEEGHGKEITRTADGHLIMYEVIKRFKGGRYKILEDAVDSIDYVKNIIKVYPQFSFNRGLGYYFPKLDMELYGTPTPYAVFDVMK